MAITIDFTSQTIVSDFNLGHIGEHNATELVITPPVILSSDPRTSEYRVSFCTAGKTVLSEGFSTIPFTIPLWSQLTQAPRISVQIIAYDTDGDYIGKSAKLSGFYFEPSITGTEVQTNGTNSDIAHEIQNKVDKVEGKTLTSNDFTDALKDKLDGIESGAEANVQADWNEADSTADGYIKNKPSLSAVATSGDFSDLAETPTTIEGYGITNAYTKTETDAALSTKQNELTAGENITIENNVISASGGGSSAVELVDPEDEEKFIYTGGEIADLANAGTRFTINGIPTYFADNKDDTILFAITRTLDPTPLVTWIRVSVPANAKTYEATDEYQLYPDTSKEDISNKVTSISDASTDTEYPSAKAVNDALKTKADVEDWDIDFDVISDTSDIKGYAKFNTEKWVHFDSLCYAASFYLPDTYFPKIKARFLLSQYIGTAQELRLTNAEYELGGLVRLYFCGFSSEYGNIKIKCELIEDYGKQDGTLTIDVQDVTE